jgi:rubredoxin
MTENRECPNCGRTDRYDTSTHGGEEGCGYTYRYDDLADYDEDEIAFSVEFECKNCGLEFEREFGFQDRVRPKNSGMNFAGIDETTGNPYIAEIDGKDCHLRCPNCGIDTALFQKERIPQGEKRD